MRAFKLQWRASDCNYQHTVVSNDDACVFGTCMHETLVCLFIIYEPLSTSMIYQYRNCSRALCHDFGLIKSSLEVNACSLPSTQWICYSHGLSTSLWGSDCRMHVLCYGDYLKKVVKGFRNYKHQLRWLLITCKGMRLMGWSHPLLYSCWPRLKCICDFHCFSFTDLSFCIIAKNI